jgi:hypothetical protein
MRVTEAVVQGLCCIAQRVLRVLRVAPATVLVGVAPQLLGEVFEDLEAEGALDR